MRFAARPFLGLLMFPVSLPLNAAHADDGGKEHGAEIYRHICQGCHMSQGQGAVGAGHYPALAGDPLLVSWEDVALTVLRGRKGMPAFGLSADGAKRARSVHLDDAEVADVVNYVRQHFGNQYKNTITAEDVARLPHADAEGALDP